jgi:hypothetical protein
MRPIIGIGLAAALAALPIRGYASPRVHRILNDDGKPFELRPPSIDLTPPDAVRRAIFFDPLPLRGVDRPVYVEQGIPLPDAVTNAILFAGGAALLGSVIAGFVNHH